MVQKSGHTNHPSEAAVWTASSKRAPVYVCACKGGHEKELYQIQK
jgi:hypothetical protein